MGGVERAFETHPIQGRIANQCRLRHERANEVIGDEMHLDFFIDHRGSFATEHIHVQSGFDVVPIEFNFPTPVIESGQQLARPELGVGEGRNQSNRLAAPVSGS
jgi:hypothetical protein